ncbi:MAG: gliding motility-associated C-terminal domain-containing protein, partial [Bacteroidia bacterium]|nr:gliding motility-associated C-terminal domain-containing protein [Bacteroidia bacterium]
SGTLTITSSCGGSTVLNAPFNTAINYTVTGVPANGAPCTVTAAYSADPTCTFTVNINAPAPCNPSSCSITALTAVPGACNVATNTYDLSGAVTFSNPPASGTLTVSSSCGGSQVFNAPFVGPLNYTLTALPSNSATCTLTAVFSASVACTFSVTFNAPAPCLTCTATANNNGPICEGQTLNLTCTPAGATSYAWAGPNSYVSAVQNPGIPNTTIAANGIYTVTITMPGGAICIATTTVTINPSPLADAGPTVTICTGGGVQLNASGGTSYSWTPATGLSNNAISNPIASPATTTLYSVTVGSNGCFSNDTVSVIVVNQLNATVNANATICQGQSVQMTAGGGSSYQWIPATGLTSTVISNPVASPTVTTTYSVIASASGGCPNDTAVVTITVNAAFNLSVSPNDTICDGQTGTVSASGATTYFWLPSASTNDTLTDSPSASQTYTVVGTFGLCTDTQTVSIIVIPSPVANFDNSGQTTLGDLNVSFNNLSTGAVTYMWYFGDGDSSNAVSPVHLYPATETYNACLTAYNALNCPNTYCTDIILKPDWTCYIPNTFTPNDDGMNDVFYAIGVNIQKFEMYIFDRWGNTVYHGTDMNEGWNGRKNNNKGLDIVQIDTYVYRVKIADSEGKTHKYTGHVNVVK